MSDIRSEKNSGAVTRPEPSSATLGQSGKIFILTKGIKFILAFLGAIMAYLLIPIFNPFITVGYLIGNLIGLKIDTWNLEKYYIIFPNIILNIIIFYLIGQMVEGLVLKKKLRAVSMIALAFSVGAAVAWMIFAKYYQPGGR